MKTFIILVSILLGTHSLLAKEKTVKKMATTKTAAAEKSKAASAKSNLALSTDVRFGDQAVGGKYQLPMEALSVVENEKSIDDLIGVRKNFQDRIARTKGMR